MLQEQTHQLQLMIATLADSVKQVTSKIDDQSALTRKSFADQKLLVDNVAEGVRLLREKVRRDQRPDLVAEPGDGRAADFNPVAAAAERAADADRGRNARSPAGASRRPPSSPTAGASPQQIYRAATRTIPPVNGTSRSPGFRPTSKAFRSLQDADDAQLYIGESHFAAGASRRQPRRTTTWSRHTPARTPCRRRCTSSGSPTKVSDSRIARGRRSRPSSRRSVPKTTRRRLAKQALDRLAKPKQ